MLSNIPSHFLFPETLEEASKIQKFLSEKVILKDSDFTISRIGGVDVSNYLNDPLKMIYASIVTLDAKSLTIQEKANISQRQSFPYIPGFLGFREAPALVEAFYSLKNVPDLLMVDGHGISHPRGLGIASHLGVLLDIPTIGVAKSLLVGTFSQTLGEKQGSCVEVIWKGKVIAVALRTKVKCRPLIISPGHKVSFQKAVDWVFSSLRGYRLPEPTRLAHLSANAFRKHC